MTWIGKVIIILNLLDLTITTHAKHRYAMGQIYDVCLNNVTWIVLPKSSEQPELSGHMFIDAL